MEIGGDRLRRLDDDEKPLSLLLKLLVDFGFEDVERAKRNAADADLECVVKLYLGTQHTFLLMDCLTFCLGGKYM